MFKLEPHTPISYKREQETTGHSIIVLPLLEQLH
uniref:Uncharacterized protein n=1 Tax=Rhizophora mucronata TaxID=61149 RepID=A0A2P2QFL1_RHIMU